MPIFKAWTLRLYALGLFCFGFSRPMGANGDFAPYALTYSKSLKTAVLRAFTDAQCAPATSVFTSFSVELFRCYIVGVRIVRSCDPRNHRVFNGFVLG